MLPNWHVMIILSTFDGWSLATNYSLYYIIVYDGSTYSDDSFLEKLEQQMEITVVDASSAAKRNNLKDNNIKYDETNMQEMLDWLDEDDERQINDKEEQLLFSTASKTYSTGNFDSFQASNASANQI